MDTSYKRLSGAFRMILAISAIGYLVLTLIKPELKNDENNLNPYGLLIYAIATVAVITAFHKTEMHRVAYIVLQILAFALTASGLVFLIYVATMIFTNEDGNLLVTSVMGILLLVHSGLLFYLFQDQKYR